MNNSFTEQTYQQKSYTASQNVQRTNKNEFHEAVSRYELRKSSRSRQQQETQQTNVITTKYAVVDNERKSAINDMENSRMSQRIAEKYSATLQNSQYDNNKQSVQEVMDKYRRGRSTQQVIIQESKYVPQEPREEVVENNFEEQEPLNYDAFQTKQQVYEIDYQQIHEDCKDYDGFKKPQREDDIQVEMIESDYVSCNIF